MKKIIFLLISFLMCMYSQNVTASSGCNFVEPPYSCWTDEGELLFFRTHFYYDPPAPENPICTWATDLPSGASYPIVSDYGEVYNDFIWIPTCGQAGLYTVNFHSGIDCGVPLSTLSVEINVYSVDSDVDGILDCDDNCPHAPNPDQTDTQPFQGNGIGDACNCEFDFNCDSNVDGTDVDLFLTDFGRNQFNDPCTNGNPCNGDVDCNAAVDAFDLTLFLEDFGRNQFNNPCPACVAGDWCVYE